MLGRVRCAGVVDGEVVGARTLAHSSTNFECKCPPFWIDGLAGAVLCKAGPLIFEASDGPIVLLGRSAIEVGSLRWR